MSSKITTSFSLQSIIPKIKEQFPNASKQALDASIKSALEKNSEDITDPNATDYEDETFLHKCINEGYTESAKKIIEKIIQQRGNLEVAGPFGDTALILASKAGNLEVAKMLLEKGADPDAQNNEGKTALQSAILRNYEDIVKMLLEKNANPDIQDYNKKQTALHLALREPSIAEMLLEKNANPSIANHKGQTFLDLAKFHGLNIELWNVHPKKQYKQLDGSSAPGEDGEELLLIEAGSSQQNVVGDGNTGQIANQDSNQQHNDYHYSTPQIVASLNIMTNIMPNVVGEISTLLGNNQEQTNSYMFAFYAGMKMASTGLACYSNPSATPILLALPFFSDILPGYLGLKPYANLISTVTNVAGLYVLAPTSVTFSSIGYNLVSAYLVNGAEYHLTKTIDYSFTGQNALGLGLAAAHYSFFVDKGNKPLSKQMVELTMGASLFSMMAQLFGKMIFNSDNKTSEVDDPEMIGHNVVITNDEL